MTIHVMLADAAILVSVLIYPCFETLVGVTIVSNLVSRWLRTHELVHQTGFFSGLSGCSGCEF